MSLNKIASIVVAAVLSFQSLPACVMCSLDNSGSGSAGIAATYGVIAMTVIMFGMLGVLYSFKRYLQWREQNPLPDYSELVNEGEKALNGESTK